MVLKRTLLPILIIAFATACNKREKQSSNDGAGATTVDVSSPRTSTYDGPTGKVLGIVRIVGDEPPVLPLAADIPVGSCFKAHERHRLLFRKAADGGVADALVAVTEYKGNLSNPTDPVVIKMEDCSLETRTVALAMGQSIHMKNRGPTAAMPQLIGLPTPAVMVAVPGGDPVILTPHAPGRFQLVDRSHPYASADVFVVNYPTVTVTNEAGRFELDGIPPGDAKLNVMLPAAGLTVSKPITVTPGKPLELNLELRFDKQQYDAALALGEREENAPSSPVPATAAPARPETPELTAPRP